MSWKERMVSKCMFIYLEVLLGEGYAEENPVKPRPLNPPMPRRGAMLLFDEGSMMYCKQI
jgi:hypothetical protein